MEIGVKIALLGACSSIFLLFCWEYGNIFSGYYRFITAYFYLGLIRKNGKLRRPPATPKYKIWLFKILGGCVYCNNVYLTTGCYLIATFPNLNFIDWLLSVTLSHVLIKIHHRFIDN